MGTRIFSLFLPNDSWLSKLRRKVSGYVSQLEFDPKLLWIYSFFCKLCFALDGVRHLILENPRHNGSFLSFKLILCLWRVFIVHIYFRPSCLLIVFNLFENYMHILLLSHTEEKAQKSRCFTPEYMHLLRIRIL